MVSHCIVYGCKNRKTQEGRKKIRAYHTYPIGPLRDKWDRALNKKVALAAYATVCSDHFLESDYSFKSNHKWALNKNAVPTKNIPQPPCKEEEVDNDLKHEPHEDYILPDNIENTTSSTLPPAKKCQQEDPSNTLSVKTYNVGKVEEPHESEVISDSRPGGHDQYGQGDRGDLNNGASDKYCQKEVISGEEAEAIKKENEELRAKCRMLEEQMKKHSANKNTLELMFENVSNAEPLAETNVADDVAVNDDNEYEDIRRLEDLRIFIKDLREMEEALQRKNSDLKLKVSQMEERIMKFKCKVAEKVFKMNNMAAKLGIGLGKCKEKGKSLQCQTNTSTNNLQSHQDTIQSYTCPAPGCNLTFSSTETLKMHLKNVHIGPEAGKIRQEETKVSGEGHTKVINNEWNPGYVCRECGYVASQESHLRLHIKGVHEKIKDHVCIECGYAAARIDTLKNHMASVHKKGEKQYKCDKCPYTSGIKNVYLDHVKAVHEKIKDFVCHECGYAASRKHTLKTHRLAVHNIGGEQLKCNHCPYKAYSNLRLKNHARKVHLTKMHLKEQVEHRAE